MPAPKPVRVIGTANGDVTLGTYVEGWRKVLSAPAGAMFKQSLTGWWPASREEVLGQFSYGVHDRINRHLPWFRKGRNWDPDRQRELLQASRQLNQPRLIIDWLPKSLVARFKHRLRDRDEDERPRCTPIEPEPAPAPAPPLTPEQKAVAALAEVRRLHNPNVEYRIDLKRESIAGFHEGIWHRVAMIDLRGNWSLVKYECLLNGQRVPFTPDTSL